MIIENGRMSEACVTSRSKMNLKDPLLRTKIGRLMYRTILNEAWKKIMAICSSPRLRHLVASHIEDRLTHRVFKEKYLDLRSEQFLRLVKKYLEDTCFTANTDIKKRHVKIFFNLCRMIYGKIDTTISYHINKMVGLVDHIINTLKAIQLGINVENKRMRAEIGMNGDRKRRIEV